MLSNKQIHDIGGIIEKIKRLCPSIKGDPLCTLLHPFMTEGFDAKYNPAIILLDVPRTYADFEQLCGRVMRSYSNDFSKQPLKMVYQMIGYNLKTMHNEIFNYLGELYKTSNRADNVTSLNYHLDEDIYSRLFMYNIWSNKSDNPNLKQGLLTGLTRWTTDFITNLPAQLNISRQLLDENARLIKDEYCFLLPKNNIFASIDEQYIINSTNKQYKIYDGYAVEVEKDKYNILCEAIKKYAKWNNIFASLYSWGNNPYIYNTFRLARAFVVVYYIPASVSFILSSSINVVSKLFLGNQTASFIMNNAWVSSIIKIASFRSVSTVNSYIKDDFIVYLNYFKMLSGDIASIYKGISFMMGIGGELFKILREDASIAEKLLAAFSLTKTIGTTLLANSVKNLLNTFLPEKISDAIYKSLASGTIINDVCTSTALLWKSISEKFSGIGRLFDNFNIGVTWEDFTTNFPGKFVDYCTGLFGKSKQQIADFVGKIKIPEIKDMAEKVIDDARKFGEQFSDMLKKTVEIPKDLLVDSNNLVIGFIKNSIQDENGNSITIDPSAFGKKLLELLNTDEMVKNGNAILTQAADVISGLEATPEQKEFLLSAINTLDSYKTNINPEDIKKVVEGFVGQAQGVVRDAAGKVQGFAQDAASQVPVFVENVKAAGQEALIKAQEVGQNLAGQAQAAASQVPGVVAQAQGVVRDAAGNVRGIVENVKEARQNLAGQVPGVVDKAKGFFNEAAQKVKGVLQPAPTNVNPGGNKFNEQMMQDYFGGGSSSSENPTIFTDNLEKIIMFIKTIRNRNIDIAVEALRLIPFEIYKSNKQLFIDTLNGLESLIISEYISSEEIDSYQSWDEVIIFIKNKYSQVKVEEISEQKIDELLENAEIKQKVQEIKEDSNEKSKIDNSILIDTSIYGASEVYQDVMIDNVMENPINELNDSIISSENDSETIEMTLLNWLSSQIKLKTGFKTIIDEMDDNIKVVDDKLVIDPTKETIGGGSKNKNKRNKYYNEKNAKLVARLVGGYDFSKNFRQNLHSYEYIKPTKKNWKHLFYSKLYEYTEDKNLGKGSILTGNSGTFSSITEKNFTISGLNKNTIDQVQKYLIKKTIDIYTAYYNPSLNINDDDDNIIALFNELPSITDIKNLSSSINDEFYHYLSIRKAENSYNHFKNKFREEKNINGRKVYIPGDILEINQCIKDNPEIDKGVWCKSFTNNLDNVCTPDNDYYPYGLIYNQSSSKPDKFEPVAVTNVEKRGDVFTTTSSNSSHNEKLFIGLNKIRKNNNAYYEIKNRLDFLSDGYTDVLSEEELEKELEKLDADYDKLIDDLNITTTPGSENIILRIYQDNFNVYDTYRKVKKSELAGTLMEILDKRYYGSDKAYTQDEEAEHKEEIDKLFKFCEENKLVLRNLLNDAQKFNLQKKLEPINKNRWFKVKLGGKLTKKNTVLPDYTLPEIAELTKQSKTAHL